MSAKSFKKIREDGKKFYGGLNQFLEYKSAAELMLNVINSEKKISVPENTDWSKLFALVMYHELGYVVFEKINNIPIIYKKKFELIERAIIEKNKKYYDLFNKINAEFSRGGIDFLPLKGISRIKSDNFRRRMDDIDLWIDEKDFSKAKTILGKFMNFVDKSVTAKRDDEFCMHVDSLIVECKDLKKHLHMSLEDFRKSSLQKELLFCFEADHAIINHPYESIKWFYSGYSFFKREKLSVDKILLAAKISKMEYSVKTYILILQNIFELNFGEKNRNYFSEKDNRRRELFFKLHNPLLPLVKEDFNALMIFIRISNSKGLKKIGWLIHGFKNEGNVITDRDQMTNYSSALINNNYMVLRAWQYVFFPGLFLRWMTKLDVYSKHMQKDMLSDDKYLPYYLWNMQNIDADKIEIIDDVLDIIAFTASNYPGSAKPLVKKIFDKYSIKEIREVAKEYEINWIIDAWLVELGRGVSKNSLRWKHILEIDVKSKKEQYRLFFKRQILLSSSFRRRLVLFKKAIFPSIIVPRGQSRKKVFLNWMAHLKSPKLCFSLFVAVFMHPR